MAISKIELKKHLQKLGIKVEGNFVRKSAIEQAIKAIAEDTEKSAKLDLD